MQSSLPAVPVALHQLPANTAPSEEVLNAFYAAMRHSGSVAAGIEAMAVRAFEQNETHLLDDVANLASHLSESLRLLAIAIATLKPHE